MELDDGARPPIARARRERADAAANRVRILDAAVRVLAERGVEGTSIDAVAREAGVGKGTIFRRFGDRSGLFQALQALLDDHLRAFQDAFMRGPPPLGPGAPAEDRLVAFLDGVLDLHDDQLELAVAVERDRWGVPTGGYRALSVHVESLIQNLVLVVQNAVDQREIGAGSSLIAFFRSLGGAVGISALGALLATKAGASIAHGLAAAGIRVRAGEEGKVPDVRSLPPGVARVVEHAYGTGIAEVFLLAAPLGLVAMAAIALMPEVPLGTHSGLDLARAEPEPQTEAA